MKRYLKTKVMMLIYLLIVFLARTASAQIGIEFTFANNEITTDGVNQYYEFDIMATATADSKFYIAQIYFYYNAAGFGESIYASGNVDVSRGSLLSNVVGPHGDFGQYTILLGDNTPTKLSIGNEWNKFDNDGGDLGYELANVLGTTSKVYVHVKILIHNTSVQSAISFDDQINQIELQQYYFDVPFSSHTVNYSPVNFGSEIIEELPVELISFKALSNSEGIELRWVTETEVNNYGFEVQRSVSDKEKNWKIIGFVEGSGNSNSPKNYQYIDKNPVGGNSIVYRLKQIDNDGAFEYSDEVEVSSIPSTFALHQNFPNPFNPTTNINFSIPRASLVSLDVYSITGEEVFKMSDKVFESGNHTVKFDGSSLPSGIYFYRLRAGSFVETKKMLLLK